MCAGGEYSYSNSSRSQNIKHIVWIPLILFSDFIDRLSLFENNVPWSWCLLFTSQYHHIALCKFSIVSGELIKIADLRESHTGRSIVVRCVLKGTVRSMPNGRTLMAPEFRDVEEQGSRVVLQLWGDQILKYGSRFQYIQAVLRNVYIPIILISFVSGVACWFSSALHSIQYAGCEHYDDAWVLCVRSQYYSLCPFSNNYPNQLRCIRVNERRDSWAAVIRSSGSQMQSIRWVTVPQQL